MKKEITILLSIFMICLTIIGSVIIFSYTKSYNLGGSASCNLGELDLIINGSWRNITDISTYKEINLEDLQFNEDNFISFNNLTDVWQRYQIINKTESDLEYVPGTLNFNGIKNINCEYSFNGDIPLRFLEVLIEWSE